MNSPTPAFEVDCDGPHRTLPSRDNRRCQNRFPGADCLTIRAGQIQGFPKESIFTSNQPFSPARTIHKRAHVGGEDVTEG